MKPFGFNQTEACGGCHFWRRLPGVGEKRGQCRIRAPKVFVLGTQPNRFDQSKIDTVTDSAWPVTFDIHWCGEFKAPQRGTDLADIPELAGLGEEEPAGNA